MEILQQTEGNAVRGFTALRSVSWTKTDLLTSQKEINTAPGRASKSAAVPVKCSTFEA